MLSAIYKDSKIIKDILSELNISEGITKEIAIQTIFNYIRFKTKHIDDVEGDKGVKTPSRFIKDGGGDCEDKATFGLLLFKALEIDTYIIDIDKNKKDYHVALGVKLNDKITFIDFISINQIDSSRIVPFNERTLSEYSSSEFDKYIINSNEVKF